MKLKSSYFLLVVAMIIFAGCTGALLNGDSEQSVPVQLRIENPLDTLHTFEIFVVDLPANLTTTINGQTANSSIGEGVGVAESSSSYYTQVEPEPGPTRHYGNFTLEPGETEQANISGLHQNGALLIVIYDDQERITYYVKANCDDLDLFALKVETDNNGAKAFHSCS